MAAFDHFSKSTPAFIALYTDLLTSKYATAKKPTIGDMQHRVFNRSVNHADNLFVVDKLIEVNSFIAKLCNKSSRFVLLQELGDMPLTDVFELWYLLKNKRFFKHNAKFKSFYKGLRIKNMKNRHQPTCSDINYKMLKASKLAVTTTKATINTTPNFLLDFGFVESVGSVLLLLKVC